MNIHEKGHAAADLIIEQGQLLPGGRSLNGPVHHQKLVESGGRFRDVHGVAPQDHGLVFEHITMVGVAQFMG